MSNELEFNKKAFEERLFLKKILPLLYKEEYNEVSFQMTPDYGKDYYDCCVGLFDPLTKSQVAIHLIELKVRDKHYDDLLFEKSKLDNLKSISNMGGGIIFYISVTPKGTFIWNISEIEKNLKFTNEEHWITTVDKSRGKKMKKVCYLSTNMAKRINVFSTELEILKLEEQKSRTVQKVIENHQKTRCIFEWLLKKN